MLIFMKFKLIDTDTFNNIQGCIQPAPEEYNEDIGFKMIYVIV